MPAMKSDSMCASGPTAMEGRSAIFSEKWIVGLVRVHSIRVTDRWIKARICAIPTAGLHGKGEIEIGVIPEHFQEGREIWVNRGYCRWQVLFAQSVIDEVLRIAASFPKDHLYHPADSDFEIRFAALMRPIREYSDKEAPHPDLLYFNRQVSE